LAEAVKNKDSEARKQAEERSNHFAEIFGASSSKRCLISGKNG